ncbi:NAD(P)/FAD-dependent oxidoreductase [Alkalibacillus salilacus]|uniref:D-amino-acid dehydrogenase n=1 Tax=Alkalibacillus salilacus TaxID=284582 RepID=A0ABT9VHW3_9BACI|nr:D-amino-acid dehydrogenase [Alkalibacillus salilacus]
MHVLVVGGGILGASAAYELVKKGKDVTLVDSKMEGQATYAGAGIVCPWVSARKDPDLYELARASAIRYPDLVESLKENGASDTGYRLCGALALAEDEATLQELYQEAVTKREETSFVGDIKTLLNQEAQAMFPPLKDNVQAVYVSGGARVDGAKLNRALLQAFQNCDGKYLEESVSLEVSSDQVVAYINQERVEADEVIVAAGAWTNDLLKPLGIELPLEPQRGQIAHLTLSQETAEWPVVLPQSSHYMLAFEGGRVVMGATREAGSGFDYRLTAGGVHDVLHEGLDVAPGLVEATLEDVRIGFRPMGPDGKPLLGRVNAFSNLTVATGLGPSGLTIGPYVGKLAAQLATGNKIDQTIDHLNPLRQT